MKGASVTSEELDMLLRNPHVRVISRDKGSQISPQPPKTAKGEKIRVAKTTRESALKTILPKKKRKVHDGRKTTDIERDLYAWMMGDDDLTDVECQPKPLKLGYRCTFKLDGTGVRFGRREYYDSKGDYTREDSIIKIKWAADKYKDVADFYIFKRGEDGQIWLTQVPPMDGKPTKRKALK